LLQKFITFIDAIGNSVTHHAFWDAMKRTSKTLKVALTASLLMPYNAHANNIRATDFIWLYRLVLQNYFLLLMFKNHVLNFVLHFLQHIV